MGGDCQCFSYHYKPPKSSHFIKININRGSTMFEKETPKWINSLNEFFYVLNICKGEYRIYSFSVGLRRNSFKAIINLANSFGEKLLCYHQNTAKRTWYKEDKLRLIKSIKSEKQTWSSVCRNRLMIQCQLARDKQSYWCPFCFNNLKIYRNCWNLPTKPHKSDLCQEL